MFSRLLLDYTFLRYVLIFVVALDEKHRRISRGKEEETNRRLSILNELENNCKERSIVLAVIQ